MNPQQAEQLIATTEKQRALKRQINLMADFVAHRLKVVNGTHLILSIGNGTERNNTEAIAYWISTLELSIQEMMDIGHTPDEYIESRLTKLLSNIFGD
ncbi:MAG: hypothetical protein RPU32_13850 [Candidatus Sedimenticola sp. (ex Thyasira tokunagai)]